MADNTQEERKAPNYEIINHIGTLRENRNGDRVELNYIRWDGREPCVYDLRLWKKKDNGKGYRPTINGLKFYYQDLLLLSKILSDLS